MADITIENKFGTMQGWNSITVNFLNRDIEGITSIKYDDSQTKENIYGIGSKPIGRSRGNYEATSSITLYKEEMDAIQALLGVGKSIKDIAPFDIVVHYEKENGNIIKDIIHNCEFTGRAVEVSQSDGNISGEYSLIVSHITWNAA